MKTLYETRAVVCKEFFEVVKVSDLCRELEHALLNYTKSEALTKKQDLRWANVWVRRIYLRKFRSLKNAMVSGDDNGSLNKLVDRQLSPSEFVNLDFVQLSGKCAQVQEALKKREISTLIADSEASVGLLVCEQCKGRNTKYVSLQTRSADEPMTVFASCWDCEINWTI